ncbi:hypothetical protein BX600DRAFT_381591 [Xylariales sp. PMI_506]|nr:hypothetical protein BX600DRAFT_381591 [Xylariales sp. PMI_506]
MEEKLAFDSGSASPNGGSVNGSSNGVGSAKKEKGRVRFNSTAGSQPPLSPTSLTLHPQTVSSISLDQFQESSTVRKPRPSLIRGSSYNSVLDDMGPDENLSPEKVQSAAAAHRRAQEVAAAMLGSYSAPSSRRNSLDSDSTGPASPGFLLPRLQVHVEDMAENDAIPSQGQEQQAACQPCQDNWNLNNQAYELVRTHTCLHQNSDLAMTSGTARTAETQGQNTAPMDPFKDDFEYEDEYMPGRKPREGVLTNLLKLYKVNEMSRKDSSGYTTPLSSGTVTPTRRKWYDQEKNSSTTTLASLAAASAILANPNDKRRSIGPTPTRPKHKRAPSSRIMSRIGRPRMEEEARITIHVANILKRQEYIIKLCRALMLYGAPTHRLEEYLRMIARVLEIDGQFLYLPGCMIISFDDMSTHTTEVKIVRTSQGVNLGKLKDVHEIYKEVLHDVISLDEATVRLDDIMKSKDKYNAWMRVLMYGLASATVAPFAFGGRPIDMPFCFLLGSMIGFLQLIVAPRSDVYINVFEIAACVVTSFLARAFGSVYGGDMFCFSAIAQSSIALILPGYLVLCSALELQSKAIVPGSIRMVYAIIYSLFLGFGITVGVAIYGRIDANATSATTCSNQLDTRWNFLFVPLFAFCLAYVNQAKWKQMPMMIIIAMIGYVVNYFASMRFPTSPQISNAFGALSVGVAANLYSRLRHGVAAAALLPAIFVQVPSGLAATGSLLSGLTSANMLSNTTTTINGTSTVSITSDTTSDGVVFNVAASMIQIAVGITVGLFFATLLIYPLGKRRSGLFTF